MTDFWGTQNADGGDADAGKSESKDKSKSKKQVDEAKKYVVSSTLDRIDWNPPLLTAGPRNSSDRSPQQER
jgi:hypothetical protein